MPLHNKAMVMKIIDEKAFTETFQYFDSSIVLEIIDIFIQEYPARIASIRNDIANGDFARLKFDAHSLKGVVANFFAHTAQQHARDLEMKGAAKDGEGLHQLADALDLACHELIEDLNTMKNRFV